MIKLIVHAMNDLVHYTNNQLTVGLISCVPRSSYDCLFEGGGYPAMDDVQHPWLGRPSHQGHWHHLGRCSALVAG